MVYCKIHSEAHHGKWRKHLCKAAQEKHIRDRGGFLKFAEEQDELIKRFKRRR